MKNKIKVPEFSKSKGFRTTEKRSELMKKIRRRDTTPELVLRKKLWNLGFRYRVNVKKLPGSPDIVLNKYKLVIFVDGGFWHGYNWKKVKKSLKSNKDFWIPKISRNIQRDKENNYQLRKMGFSVIRFWDHEVQNNIDKCISKIDQIINEKKKRK